MLEEVELPAGNSQGEVDRLPAGNAGISRSRARPDSSLDSQSLTCVYKYVYMFPLIQAARPCYRFCCCARDALSACPSPARGTWASSRAPARHSGTCWAWWVLYRPCVAEYGRDGYPRIDGDV